MRESEASPRAGAPGVVVVGGGIVGLSCAWRCAAAGLSVAVVDPDPGSGSTWVAAGMLAPVTESHFGEETLLRLNLAASRRYPSFVAELERAAGVEVAYEQSGTLLVARDADELAVLEELHDFRSGLGLSARRLRARECRRLEPALAPGVRGGLLVEGDHRVDPRALTRALLAACARAGVALERRRAAALDLSGGAVCGVALEGGGGLPASAVVLSAGCWSASIEGLPPDAAVPVRPVKGQLVNLRDPGGTRLCERTIRSPEVYLVPRRDGTVVVGGTVEEKGFDTSVTAGALLELLEEAAALVPGVRELDLGEALAGLRPGSPDNAPMIGPASVPGLVVATGHYRNGVLLAPVTADHVARLLATGEGEDGMEPFSPTRFSGAAKMAG
ncbi:MAG TPA: glycine oxidase ThiO [Actinomycetota bacterium]|nr:glycine oxidase ThiO [Actinomycetota bacterium]